MSDELFSLKMRASQGERHISGAEKILTEKQLSASLGTLLTRALKHAAGEPDFINFKVEKLNPDSILHIDALPVKTISAQTPEEGLSRMRGILDSIGIARSGEIVSLLRSLHGMRGAVLLDADTLERLEEDPERGIRATLMDAVRPESGEFRPEKDHFSEAVVLAAKVANAPGIAAELCISDDPDYVTGYIASKTLGYIRITPLKEKGCPAGGRIFLYRGRRENIRETIDFLERTPVLVHGIPDRAGVRPPRLQRIAQTLQTLRERDLFREEPVFDSAPGPHVLYNGRECLMFCSNDYLDLANHPRVKAAVCKAVREFGAGTGGSRLTTGTQPPHRALERELARFKGTEEAVLFGAGFAANQGAITALCGRNDVIFSDEYNHASIIDGCRLSGARIVVYRHCDMDDLERKIRAISPCSGLVVSDAVFSMDGDVAPLPELLAIAERHDLFTMIDEAHSTGVLGRTGHGIQEHFGLKDRRPDLLMGTLSKSAGSAGGFLCCTHAMADFLRNRARSYIFSTSMPAGTAAASLAALRIIESEPRRAERLRSNVRFLLEELRRRGIETASGSAIVPVILRDNAKTLEVAGELRKKGILVSPIRYPSVPEGTARLRITVMQSHTEKDLTALADALAEAVGKH